MLDVAWPELLVVGIVTLVAVGPKDLPKVMYTLGRWVGRARLWAQDFSRLMEQVSYEAELAEKAGKKKAEASPAAESAETSSEGPHGTA